MTDADARYLQERFETLLTALRPNSVGIVDGFDHEDVVLNSTLGSYDGRVYERLFAEAQKSPLNQGGVSTETFHTFMKPLMQNARL